MKHKGEQEDRERERNRRYKTEKKSAQMAGKTQETWRTQEIPHSGKFPKGLIFENFKVVKHF